MNKLSISVALVCLSAVAVAQSEASKDKAPAQDQNAAASTQTAGKRMHKPFKVSADVSAGTAAPTVHGGKTANDDWQTSAAKSSQPTAGNGKTNVAGGEVNGDGAAAARNSAHATESLTVAQPSSVTQPRDLATGQASGKRQHQPVTITKVSGAKTAQK